MSAIQALGGSNLSQFLHKISKKKTPQTSTISPVPGGVGGTPQPGGTSLFSQIQQTVTNALQQAKASGSTKDPNQIVEDSLASLFRNVFSGKSPPASGQAPPSPASLQAFQSALQSSGISPQEFHSDLQSAIQDAQNSPNNPANASSALAKGTTLDVTG